MKISVITWDASFRERFHTVDSFCQQEFPENEFEFIWVDYYNNTNSELIDRLNRSPNARLLNLNNPRNAKWHLGKCINEGVKASVGDIIVLPDGDIIVGKNHLSVIESEMNNLDELIIYFRRWDEQKESHCANSYDINYLANNSVLTNPTNYAGCIAMRRASFELINGYEEHDSFAGAGANGLETYLRFRNAGLAIKWHKKKIFHPWHDASGTSDKMNDELVELSKYINWLKPYCGIEQSWILKCREMDLAYKANDGTVERYLQSMPVLNQLNRHSGRKKSSGLGHLKKLFR